MPLIRRLWPTLLASFIGTFVATALGLGLLTPEAAALARKALGIALILYGILGVSRIRLQVPPRAEPWLGPLMGAANGAVSTATGVFMFPVIPYIQSLGLDRDDLVQAQGISFTVSTFALTFVLLGNGTLNATNAAGSLVAMAVTFVGMFLGQYVRKFIHPEVFRFLFFTGMLVLGVHLAFIPLSLSAPALAPLRPDRRGTADRSAPAAPAWSRPSAPRPDARTARARRNADRAAPLPASP